MIRSGRRGLGVALAATAFLAVSTATAPADTSGLFAIGDGNSAANASVEFWGAQWWKDNTVSGGTAPASFKGLALTITPTGPCSGTFTTRPGNSVDGPASVGAQIQVLVVDSVTKSGPVISGTYDDIDVVNADPGYGPNPGHAGTGTVVADCVGGGGGGVPT
jgi:hypothetical protein